ncbi:WYL domain-containing protein [Chitinophaga parva]|uniref:WYL domain-containing protein n=1 Tax=Chitinophaga parva TaxID=2169414 RepID=A0A2T7BLY4_9BACT|nr:WYL domain-containing protein [Chitinophaga parva]PUZ28693.1 WYL domain-containing protein [Chitinophaga parva]
MPVNRNALIRYKLIDNCLRNRRRRWTLEDLIDTVSEGLYEYEGIDKGISRRTLQADLQMMRSDKLGYNAPIIIVNKKYYTYEDASYSITNIPLSEQDLHRMNEAVEVLKQFKGFNHFNSLQSVVQKLEDHVYAATHHTKTVIDFEKNDQLKGLEHLDVIYQSIVQQKPVRMVYKSFKAREQRNLIFHVWWLKEFKNRWFAVGVVEGGAKDPNHTVLNLALDRMGSVVHDETVLYRESRGLDAADFYKNVIGPTVQWPREDVQTVIFFANKLHAPYIETKPLHPSQQVKERLPEGIVFTMQVQLNNELEKELLGFGDGVVVLAPHRLRRMIRSRLRKGLAQYEDNYPYLNRKEGD